LVAAAQFLEKAIYQWGETTVSALWSGNGYVTVPGKPWQVTQYPAYCYGADAAQKAACQNTGATISSFLQSEGGNASKLGFPCPE
jgi:hypothetical protein